MSREIKINRYKQSFSVLLILFILVSLALTNGVAFAEDGSVNPTSELPVTQTATEPTSTLESSSTPLPLESSPTPTPQVLETPAPTATEFVQSLAVAPTLINPSNILEINKPVFSWNEVPGSTAYELQILIGTEVFTTTTVSPSNCVEAICSFSFEDTFLALSYNWQVRSFDGTDWSDYSPALNFIILPTPQLLTPNTTISASLPTLNWLAIAGAKKYKIEVTQGAKVVFSTEVPTSSCLKAACSYNFKKALADGTYTWKARTYKFNHWGPYSESFTFTIQSIPTIISPMANIYKVRPAFTWSPVKNATKYELQVISGSKTILDKTISSSICTTTCSYIPEIPLPQTSLKWRVRANSRTGWASYSPNSNFTISNGQSFVSTFDTEDPNWIPDHGDWSYSPNCYQGNGVGCLTLHFAGMGLDNPDTNVYVENAHYDQDYSDFDYTVRFFRSNGYIYDNEIYFRGDPYHVNYQNEWSTGYIFSFTNNGHYDLSINDSGQSLLRFWSGNTDAINRDGWNSIRIVAIGPHIQIFINDEQIIDIYDSQLKSGSIGFGPRGRMTSYEVDIDAVQVIAP